MTDRTPTGDLRERLAEVLHEKFDWWITAEWICCEPLAKGHKLCKKGHATREMVSALLADDPEGHPPTSPILDALVPVFEAALTRARASCCEDGDRTYTEMERHLTERAEQAEASAAAAVHLLEHWGDEHVILRAVDGSQVHATWCYRCRIERAEAAVQRVRDLAEAAKRDTAQLFARQFGGAPFPATLRADDVLAALDQPEETS